MKNFWTWPAKHRPAPAGAASRLAREAPSHSSGAPRAARQSAGNWPRARLVVGLSVLGAAFLVGWEVHTSRLESHWLANYAQRLTWKMQDGPCAAPLQAPSGPYDQRLGYAHLAALDSALLQRGFVITRQACPSPELAMLARHGIAPPYDEKETGTLHILDRDQGDLYRAPLDRFHFGEYAEIPPQLVASLLFIENRQLLDEERPNLNPALEWDRLAYACGEYAFNKVTRSGSVIGGSTLATQLEKFRHSPQGRTAHASDKLRQIAAASLRAYRTGVDTRAMRRNIVVEYLNSMPLGAATDVGEVTGLGQGIWAWFGKTPSQMVADLKLPENGKQLGRKAETYKQALSLIMATRRPTLYLAQDRDVLERRLQSYLPLLAENGVISAKLAAAARRVPLRFRSQPPAQRHVAFVDRKATNAVRSELLDLVDVKTLYDLDRYDLRVETSIDASVQEAVTATLKRLRDPGYLRQNGFYGEHLLGSTGDPAHVVYSFSLYESTPAGNRMRVQADNLEKPLDINRDVKLEMGSTAKLRTMANYLMVIADLYQRHRDSGEEGLAAADAVALDPITRWVLGWLRDHPGAGLEDVLQASLERQISAGEDEAFFTGEGVHHFVNFNHEFEGMISLRTAFQNSVNLVYIRLMRELVQYYTGDLGYDARAILGDQQQPDRQPLLDAEMDREARQALWKFYRGYQDLGPTPALRKICGKEARGLRRFAIFYLSEHPDATLATLRGAAREVFPDMGAEIAASLPGYFRAFAGKGLSLGDVGYLLNRHPLEVWLVRDLRDHPGSRWDDVAERSAEARHDANEWINRTRFKHAQDVRLRIQLERLAFDQIHKAWKKLGYPFESLVPSLATAIGSSADRPYALAELVGIIQNDGVRTPFRRVEALHFAESTPYETHFEPASGPGEHVMPRIVARTLKSLMQEVVEQGTARRVQGVLKDAGGKVIPIGGKTGSGDNRYETFTANGAVTSSRAINRTASFVFVIGDRFFGMVSAYVPGEEAGRYSFTSSLALQAFKMLAPAIEPLVAGSETRAARAVAPVPSPRAAAASRRDIPALRLAVASR